MVHTLQNVCVRLPLCLIRVMNTVLAQCLGVINITTGIYIGNGTIIDSDAHNVGDT